MKQIVRLARLCWESEPILVLKEELAGNMDMGNKEKGWKRYSFDTYFSIGFTTKPMSIVAVKKDNENQSFKVLENPQATDILEAYVQMISELYSELHWKQQREILLDIGKKISDTIEEFYKAQAKLEGDSSSLEISISQRPFDDVILIEEMLEKFLGISTD